MSKNKITGAFRLFSFGAVLLSTVLAKALYIIYIWAASDIMVGDAVKYLCYYGYDLMNRVSVALVISTTVYAHSYFGKKTCIGTSLVSLGSLAVGKVIMFVYNLLVNELSAPHIISGSLSYVVEILFDALIILLAIIFSYIFAKKRDCSQKQNRLLAYSPAKSAFSAAGAYFTLLIIDLSVMNVIPFFLEYSDPTVKEIKKIISDYLYYLFSLPVCLLLIFITFILLTKVTGKLRTKQYFKPIV